MKQGRWGQRSSRIWNTFSRFVELTSNVRGGAKQDPDISGPSDWEDGRMELPFPGIRKSVGGAGLGEEGGRGFAEVRLELPVGHPGKVERQLVMGVWSPGTHWARLMAGWHLGVTRREEVQELGPGAHQH